MDKKSKIIITALVIVIICLAFSTYYFWSDTDSIDNSSQSGQTSQESSPTPTLKTTNSPTPTDIEVSPSIAPTSNTVNPTSEITYTPQDLVTQTLTFDGSDFKVTIPKEFTMTGEGRSFVVRTGSTGVELQLNIALEVDPGVQILCSDNDFLPEYFAYTIGGGSFNIMKKVKQDLEESYIVTYSTYNKERNANCGSFPTLNKRYLTYVNVEGEKTDYEKYGYIFDQIIKSISE